MRAFRSHGRLPQVDQGEGTRPTSSRLALAIIVPGLVALGIGLWVGVSLNEEAAENEDVHSLQALSRESGAFADGLKARIDAIKAQADKAARQTAQEPYLESNGSLLHWSMLDLAPDAAPVVRRALRREDLESAAPTAIATERGRTEARYLAFLVNQLKSRPFSESGVQALPFQYDAHGRREWLALVFVEQEQPNGRAVAHAALIDPAETFRGFHEFGSRERTDERRAYLITRDGNVLAHSKESYIGADVSATSVYQKALRPVFDGTLAAGAGRYHAVDQFPVLAAYSRVSDLPLAVVIEEAFPVNRAGISMIGGATAQRMFGRLLTTIGILLFGGLLIGWILDRRIRRMLNAPAAAPAEEQLATVDAETVLAAVSAPEPEEAPAESPKYEDEMEQAIRETAESTRQPANAKSALPVEMETVRQFEIQARLNKDDRAIPALLAEAARNLSESPVIYFGYHGGVQAALTQAHAGFNAANEPGSMSFPVTDEMIDRIIQGAREGRIASMTRYEPLARLVLARLGSAHFEGWAVTSYTHPKRGAQVPRLLGFLVIAQAGIVANDRREALARLIFSAGMILGDRGERTLNAQPSQARAATANAPSVAIGGPSA